VRFVAVDGSRLGWYSERNRCIPFCETVQENPEPVLGACQLGDVMSRSAGVLLALGLAGTALAQEIATFRGAWFEIEYPADFVAVPSLPSTTADGADSATFTAPDGTVSFYVFAPQWGGNPADIALDPATETLESERSATEGPVTRRWFTIAARDGGYRRSYLTTTDERGPSSRTIGLRYASSDALARYQADYLAFRSSLQLLGH
jgi:hypothetical protein